MILYALRRLAITVPVLVVISFGTFWAAGEISSPTAQLTLNPRISPEAKQAYVESLGLDQPFLVQYGKWFGNFVTGDFGTSLVRNGQAVWPFVERALANTLLLVAAAVGLSLLIGLAVGTVSAIRQGSLWDYTSVGVSSFNLTPPVRMKSHNLAVSMNGCMSRPRLIGWTLDCTRNEAGGYSFTPRS